MYDGVNAKQCGCGALQVMIDRTLSFVALKLIMREENINTRTYKHATNRDTAAIPLLCLSHETYTTRFIQVVDCFTQHTDINRRKRNHHTKLAHVLLT